jgi:HD-GYP domain-containing protein (c-di-GMP phosphodiesterase class II)
MKTSFPTAIVGTAERRVMEMHPGIGERALTAVPDFAEVARITRHHHERWDGDGYLDGLSGEDIPLMSRIIAVAEAYSAMTSDCPYRDAMPTRVARLRLTECVASQFDPAVVAAFEAILAGASEDYRSARRSDFKLAHTTGSPDRSRLTDSVSSSWD